MTVIVLCSPRQQRKWALCEDQDSLKSKGLMTQQRLHKGIRFFPRLEVKLSCLSWMRSLDNMRDGISQSTGPQPSVDYLYKFFYILLAKTLE